MIEEHALSLIGELKKEDLEYLVRKANKLGTAGRRLSGIKIERLDASKEILFIVDDPSTKTNLPLC